MSDPIFLRNMMSGSVYAEQMNAAQIQGQAAARERATKARMESLKDEQAMIVRLEESAKLDVRDEQQRNGSQEQGESSEDEDLGGRYDEDADIPAREGFHRIDFTV